MKLRSMLIMSAIAVLGMAGCSDDITNVIEEVVATAPPVTNTNTPTNTPTVAVTPPTMGPRCAAPGEGVTVACGDGACHEPEQCDDGGMCVGGGNDLGSCTGPGDCPDGTCTPVGGDGCAANCTNETARAGIFGEGTEALVQTASFAIPVALTGGQTLILGSARDDDTVDVNGEVTFRPGDIPIATKANGINIDPASVPGLVCACVRGIVAPAFGPGNSGAGLISCGGELEDVDYVLSQDHHTDPLDNFNGIPECSAPPDPDCTASSELAPGVVSRACREQEDEDCNEPSENRHAGVCNSPRVLEFSGVGPRGSAFYFNNTAIGLLSDQGQCNTEVAGMDPCPFPDYGPDCIPCTDDDADLGVAENNGTTTGMAQARVLNAANTAGNIIDQGSTNSCDSDCRLYREPSVASVRCACATVAQVMRPLRSAACAVVDHPVVPPRTDRPFDCDALLASDTGGLSGGGVAIAFPSIDAATIGDNVTTALFAFE